MLEKSVSPSDSAGNLAMSGQPPWLWKEPEAKYPEGI